VEEISLLNSKEKHQNKSHSAEASTSNPEIKLENLEVEVPKVKLYDLKGENFQNTHFSLIDTFTNESKETYLVPNVVYTRPILSLPEIKVYIPQNPEDHLCSKEKIY
jgi:hypothetical protein